MVVLEKLDFCAHLKILFSVLIVGYSFTSCHLEEQDARCNWTKITPKRCPYPHLQYRIQLEASSTRLTTPRQPKKDWMVAEIRGKDFTAITKIQFSLLFIEWYIFTSSQMWCPKAVSERQKKIMEQRTDPTCITFQPSWHPLKQLPQPCKTR